MRSRQCASTNGLKKSNFVPSRDMFLVLPRVNNRLFFIGIAIKDDLLGFSLLGVFMFMKSLGICVAVAGLALANPAVAATTIWDGTGATDSVTYGQFGSTVLSGTAFTSVGGANGTVTTGTGGSLARLNQSTTWGGNFAPGAPLLWNQGGAGTITFTFAGALSAIGAQIQANYYGNFLATIGLSDNTSFNLSGVSNGNANNSAIFIGAKSDTASITSITFSAVNPNVGGEDFAIGELSLTNAISAAPEPGTWMMMILGFGIVGASLRRRRVKTTVSYA